MTSFMYNALLGQPLVATRIVRVAYWRTPKLANTIPRNQAGTQHVVYDESCAQPMNTATTDSQQEKEWVQAALDGDATAFEYLVDAYAGPVYNLAYRMLGTPTEAEDAAQEVFIRIYDKLHTYDPDRKLSTWILSIASHYCIDVLRRRRLDKVSVEEMPPWRPLVATRPDPEHQVTIDDRDEQIQGLLQHLRPKYRMPLVLYYWYDMSYKEICETTGLSMSAVKSRLHRARHMMADVLQEQAPHLLPPGARPAGEKNPVTETPARGEER